MQPRTWI